MDEPVKVKIPTSVTVSPPVKPSPPPKRSNTTLWITVALLPMAYFVVGRVLMADRGVFSAEIQSMVIGMVMGTVLGSIVTYWLGSSSGSARKDEAAAQKEKI